MNDDQRLARVLRICEEALGRDGAERAAYLDDACGADEGVRRDVETLLAHTDESGDGFLATPPWEHARPALSAGEQLGPYQVTGTLGSGGMGVVYKARDTRLGRTVAIKVIACDDEMDASVRERFTLEARAIAALNHPNICAIYDIGREVPSGGDGRPLDFIVIEYLEGHTLAERLSNGPLTVRETLQVGIHIADALAAAHRQNIVHGDLKPANIILSWSPGGPVAKLLDFGLAELVPSVAAGRGDSRPAAASAAMRTAVRGTLAYMAPEQFEHRTKDTRTDVYAFGCVLHEMLTGRRAFAGETDSSVAAAILAGDRPARPAAQPTNSAALHRLIARCLKREPDDRWQSAREVADELRQIAQRSAIDGRGLSLLRKGHPVWSAVAAIAVVTGAVAWGGWRAGPPPPLEPRTLVVPAPDRVAFGGAQNVEFSADGRAVVYFGTREQKSALYWQDLNEADGRLIPGTESAGEPFLTPFVSPDGRRVGFVRAGRLMAVPLRSGQMPTDRDAVVLADGISWIRGASWGENGTIVYCPNANGGLWRVSANGGPSRQLTFPDPAGSSLGHSWPQVLPGGRAALFTIRHASGRQDRDIIAVVALDSGRITPLVEGGSYGRYAPSGHLVFARNGSLLAVPFDLASLAVRGRPVPVLTGVSMESAGSGSARFAIARTGALVYEPAPPRPNARNSVISVDRDGNVSPVTADSRSYQSALALSADGRRLVVRIEDATRLDSQLWAYEVASRQWQQLTFEGDNAAPLFSPSGDRIVFSSNRDGAFNLYMMSAKGGPAERLTRSPYWQYAGSWSPDGQLIAYYQQGGYQRGPATAFRTWLLSTRDRRTWLWAPDLSITFGAKFSPDRRWIAYQSPQFGRSDVYVRSFPGPGPSLRVSGPNGGSAPFWSRDGRTVLYLDGSAVMAVHLHSGASRYVSPPHLAFALPFAPAIAGSTNVLALTPGERHVVLVRPDPQRAPQTRRLLVIPNWTEQLKAKVPRS